MSLPRWIAIGNDPHAAVVHQADDGFWRANNWQGCLGGFASEEEAVLAIYAAPPRPKKKRQPKAEPPGELKDAMKDWRGLTNPASGYIVRDERGRAIGVVKPAGDRFEAWEHGNLLGLHPTRAAADAAVRAAKSAKKARMAHG